MNRNQDPTNSSPNVLHNQSTDFSLSKAVPGSLAGERIFPSVKLGETEFRVSYDEESRNYLVLPPMTDTQTHRDTLKNHAISIKKLPLSLGTKVGEKLTLGRKRIFGTNSEGQEADYSDIPSIKRVLEVMSSQVSREHITFEVTPDGLRYTDHSMNGTKLGFEHDPDMTVPRRQVLAADIGEQAMASTKQMEVVKTGLEVGSAKKTLKGEDVILNRPAEAIFGVFDGAGGHEGGHRAADVAKDIFYRSMGLLTGRGQRDSSIEPATMQEHIRKAMVNADEAVGSDKAAGVTTGVVAKVMTPEGSDIKYLVWSSVGDSRIYVYNRHHNDIVQLSHDEGEGKNLYNALGGNAHVSQVGVRELYETDEIILCSDGITGDKGDELMLNHEIAQIMQGSRTVQDAANNLLEKSRKHDDKSVLVVKP